MAVSVLRELVREKILSKKFLFHTPFSQFLH
jgi:hypothetical protein